MKVVLRSSAPVLERAAAIVDAMGRVCPPPACIVRSPLPVLESGLSPGVLRKALAFAKSHEWQYSTDGGDTWREPEPLPSGTKVTVRYRRRQRVGQAKWSKPVLAVVP